MKLHAGDIFFIAGIIFLVVMCGFALNVCGKYPIKEEEDIKRKEAFEKRKIWIRSSIIWLSIYYWLILNSILTTLLVLYISCYENMGVNEMQARVFFYSVISLFSSICPYVVNLQEISKAYRKAYRVLDKALVLNENLAEALVEGEKIIYSAHKK